MALPMVAGLLLAMMTVPEGGWAQRLAPVELVAATSADWKWQPLDGPPRRQPQEAPPSPATATALSALLPGAGQHQLGQRRKWLYLAVETLGWAFYAERRAAASDFRRQYRDFAWSEARLQSGPRTDGPWEYYETLTNWEESGAFDADALAVGVQPEGDPTVFNGSIWLRANQLFLPGGASVPESDPQYQRALEYYRAHAFGSDFLWAWTGTGGAQDEYAGLIRQSDERFRQSTNVLGAIIANHVLSAVDAYLIWRGFATPADIRLVPGLGSNGARWSAWVSLEVL